MKGWKRTLSAITMVCVAAISLSSCAGITPGSTEDLGYIAELENRGFTYPELIDDGLLGDTPSYKVMIGGCPGQVNFTESQGWTYRPVGFAPLNNATASKIRDRAVEYGLDDCINASP